MNLGSIWSHAVLNASAGKARKEAELIDVPIIESPIA